MSLAKTYLCYCLLLFTFAGSMASASVSAQGRAYMYSCGYYSNKTADVIVTYDDGAPNNATEVTLNYVFRSLKNPDLGDEFSGKVVMVKDSDRRSYSAKVTQTIAARSSPIYLNVMEFFILAKYADGTVTQNPVANLKPFKVLFADDFQTSCIAGPDSFPPYVNMNVEKP
jgi:hypothetical protein